MKQSDFGSIIRSLREQNHLTQAALAEKMGVTDKAVSKWERGISYPDISLFHRLADELGVTAEDLLKACVGDGQSSRLVRIFEMSHDIRTPLHIILGCAEMAKTHCEDRERLMRYLESIRVSGQYLLQTINQMMQVTNPDPEDVSSKEFPSNLNELSESLKDASPQQDDIFLRYDFSGKRILVAEDIELNREIAMEILRKTGAEVEFAEDGRICVEMVEKAPAGHYDIILMDILMPHMDGIEATRRIRASADAEKAAVPIIAMTANVYEKDRQMAFKAGMNAFTEKPVFAEDLFSTIDQFLKK